VRLCGACLRAKDREGLARLAPVALGAWCASAAGHTRPARAIETAAVAVKSPAPAVRIA
jgi:hypothetical protein